MTHSTDATKCRRFIGLWGIIAAGIFTGLLAPASPARGEETQAMIDDAVQKAIEKGVRYLWSTQQADGGWKSYTAHNVGGPGGKPMPMEYRIGPTGICVYALLESGVSPADPKLTKALEYLLKEDTDKTYGRAFRCLALSTALRKDKDRKHPLNSKIRAMLRQEIKTLILCMQDEGGYTYYSKANASNDGADSGVRFIVDHSNSQYGLLGVWAGSMVIPEIPLQYWKKSLDFWKGIQNPDGGWGYTKQSRSASEIAMALAGVASLYVCIDNLNNQEALTCKGNQEMPQVTRGMDYIGKNLDDIRNRAWFYYGLYGVERVAFATGYKYFGKVDWYKWGRSELLSRQEPDGHWTRGAGPHGGGPDISTSYALLFLIRGSRPVVFNRLEYDGDWNNRPRSLANLTRWFSDQFENDLYWQIVNFKVTADKWHDAPLLVITGSKAPTFTDAQLTQLRAFVDQGGTIFCIDECGSIAFRKTMRTVFEKLFPGQKLERVARTHPMYAKPYPLYGSPPLQMVSNGVRPLAIYTDLDLARAWQSGNSRGYPTYYKVAANVVAYVSAQTALSGQLHSRGTAVWPEEPTRSPRLTFTIARLKHNANCDPEPLAYERLSRQLLQSDGIKLDIRGPMEISELETSGAKLATMTGTGKLELSAAQKAGIKAFLDAGGTLLVDAAGGDKEFADSAEAILLEICDQTTPKLVATTAELYNIKDYEITKARYRNELAGQPRLRTILYNKRMAVYFSRDDITEGLLGIMCQTIKGYTPSSARDIVRNIVILTSGQKIAAKTPGSGSSKTGTGGATNNANNNYVATASVNNDDAGKAVDGDSKTGWSTGRAMKKGDWFQVDLGEETPIKSVGMDTSASPKDYPKSFKLALSRDGTNWMSGQGTIPGATARLVTFPQAIKARYIRFEVASADVTAWSIYEVLVNAGGGGGGRGNNANNGGNRGGRRPPKGVLPE